MLTCLGVGHLVSVDPGIQFDAIHGNEVDFAIAWQFADADFLFLAKDSGSRHFFLPFSCQATEEEDNASSIFVERPLQREPLSQLGDREKKFS